MKETRYVVVQFIEFGGDHLDRLMDPAHDAPEHVRSIVERSRAMLAGCQKVVYFLNGRVLFGDGAAAAIETLVKRLQFLARTLPAAFAMMFHITRVPPALTATETVAWMAALATRLHVAVPPPASLLAPATPAPAQCAEIALKELLAAVLPRATVGPSVAAPPAAPAVCATDHLTEDGLLHAPNIVATLARMFRGQLMVACDVRLLACRHLVQCYRCVEQRLSGDELNVWLTQAEWAEYLDDLHDADLPPSTMLRQFSSIADALCASALAIRRSGLNHANMSVQFTVSCAGRHPDTFHFREPPCPAAPPAVRFPLHAPLLDALDAYLHYNVPVELWLQPARSCAALCRAALDAAVASLVAEMQRRLGALAAHDVLGSVAGGPATADGGPATPAVQDAHMWLWLLEDLVLGGHFDATEDAPLTLTCTPAAWAMLSHALELQPGSSIDLLSPACEASVVGGGGGGGVGVSGDGGSSSCVGVSGDGGHNGDKVRQIYVHFVLIQ